LIALDEIIVGTKQDFAEVRKQFELLLASKGYVVKFRNRDFLPECYMASTAIREHNAVDHYCWTKGGSEISMKSTYAARKAIYR
jgi:hypothetical protein